MDAIDLQVGDVLLLRSCERAAITTLVIRHARLPVYNFHVEELHCYAVGSVQVLVHNNSGEVAARLKATEHLPEWHPDRMAAKRDLNELLAKKFGPIDGSGASVGRMTAPQARSVAEANGWREVANPGFNSHGQPVFTDGKHFYTPDADSHIGGVWKLFNKKLDRIGTLDADLNKIGK